MNHLDYENMVFAREELAPPELSALHEHLQTCGECRSLASAWMSVESELTRAEVLAPVPGFSARWKSRLAEDRLRSHNRQITATLGIGAASAAILIVWLGVHLWPMLASPKVLAYTLVYQVLTIGTALSNLRIYVSSLLGLTSGWVVWAVWILVLGIACQLAVIWWASLRLAIKPRRMTK